MKFLERGEKNVDKEKFKCIVSVLMNCELSPLEKQFLSRVEEHFEKNGMLTEQQESILKGVYREKIRWMKRGLQREEAFTAKSTI